MKKLSIIIPVYNCEKFIIRCLSSIYEQKLSDFEVIIIDDASTDNSFSIIYNFCNHHQECLLLKNSLNMGPSASRNLGLKVATGKYIMFLDADDYWKSGTIESLLSEMENFELIIGGFWISENNIILNEKKEKRELINCITYIYKMLKPETQYLFSVLWNKVFLKSIIDKYNIVFDEDVSICEDWSFILPYISVCSKIKVLEYSFYFYEQGNSLSLVKRIRARGENWKSLYKVYMIICRYCNNFEILDENIVQIANFMLNPLIKELIECRKDDWSEVFRYRENKDIIMIINNVQSYNIFEKITMFLFEKRYFRLLYIFLGREIFFSSAYRKKSKYKKVLSLK